MSITSGTARQGFARTVHPESGGEILTADWVMPENPKGLVLFAHGSGSGRHSPRNRAVAADLLGHGLGTLLLDLLTPAEESVDLDTAQHRFDIPLLRRRLHDATLWIRSQPGVRELSLGYFGASTGAAAALCAAADLPGEISAIVSRGGRPDLAGDLLPLVKAPTLLLVGGNDHDVIGLNRQAMNRMLCPAKLVIISGAGHLFEEGEALAEVAALAAGWFLAHAHGRSAS